MASHCLKQYACLFLFFTCGVLVSAERAIPFQGRLKAAGGLHVDNPAARFTAAVYAEESDGSALWSASYDPVVVNKGLFRLELAIPDSVLVSDETRWLGLAYEDEDELPRTRLLAVPYARVAKRAEAAGAPLRQELDQLQADMDSFVTAAPAGVNVRQYGAIGDYASHPLSAEQATAINARADIGAEAGDEQDWAAIQLALVIHGRAYIPRGEYRINKTIDMNGTDIGEGALLAGAGAKQTTLYGTTPGMTMVDMGSYNVLTDVALNGGWDQFVAKWGVYIGPGQRGQLYRCYLRYFSDACLVLDGTQNSCYMDSFLGDAKYCIRLMNGVRNCSFYNCNTAQWSMTKYLQDPESHAEPPWSAADERAIYMGRAYQSDGYPAGMGSDRNVQSSNHGNSNITFYGGIFEHITGADYGLELSDYCAERITFLGCELHGGAKGMVYWPRAQTPYPGQGEGGARLTIDNCTILKPNSTQTGGPTPVARSAYSVNFSNNYYPKRGSPEWFEAIPGSPYATVHADAATRRAIGNNSATFQSDIGSWINDGSQATVSWDGSQRALLITSDYISHGAKISPNIKQTAGTLWLFRIMISEIENSGAQTVRLLTKYLDPVDDKWKTHGVANTLGPGYHEIPYICHGDEQGLAIYPTENLSTTLRIKLFDLSLPGDL